MNKFLYFAFGFCAGLGGTLFVLSIFEKHKKRTASDENIDDENIDIDKKIEKDCEKLVKEAFPSATKFNNDSKEKIFSDLSHRYDSINSVYYKSPLEHSDEDGASFNFDTEEDKSIYLINWDRYGLDGFEARQFTYYSDNVLADENEKMLNIDDVLGPDNNIIEMFKTINVGDIADEIYVRNENTKEDYAILWSDGSYAQIVLGIDE